MTARWLLLLTLLLPFGSENILANPPSIAPERVSFINIRLYVPGPVPFLTALDMNRDGLPDLVIQDGNAIEVHLQDAALGITPQAKARLDLPARDFLYDVGTLGAQGAMGVVAVHADGVEWYAYDHDAFAPPVPLLEYPTLFRGACSQEALHTALLFDMEADGDTDLVVPSLQGFEIFGQTPDGYALSQRLRAESTVALAPYGRSIQDRMQRVFTLPNFHFGDVNGDRRLDLLIEGYFDFDIYTQDASGRYDATPSMTVSINATHAKKKRGQRFFSYEVPPRVVDLNADGFVDAVATFPSKGVTAVYLGKPGTRVFETPDQVIRFDGWTLAHILQDVSGDTRIDLILAKMEKVGFWGGLQILMTRTVDIDILAYLSQPDGHYPESPSFARQITVPLILSASHQMVKIETPYLLNFAGDYNRDGRCDLLFKSGNEALSVNFGQADGVFSERVGMTIPISDTAGYSTSQPTVADLNGDGISDLVLNHRDFQGEQCLIEVVLSRVK